MEQKFKLNETVSYSDGNEIRKGVVRVVDLKTFNIVNEYFSFYKEESNMDKMFKLCSDLSNIFPHPYYFNWSPPTNWRAEQDDVTYAIIRIGKYIPKEHIENGIEYLGRSEPVEKQLYFGPVQSILQFDFFENISSLEDAIEHKDDIIKYIDSLF